MPWIRWLVSGLSPCRHRFNPWLVCVGFVGDKVAVGQVYLSVLELSLVRIIPPIKNTHISFMYHHRYVIFAVNSVNN